MILFNPAQELANAREPESLKEVGTLLWRMYQRCAEASSQGYRLTSVDRGGNILVTCDE